MRILNVSNLKIEFKDYTLFENISFSLNDNDRLALIGPNGNGKTTLLKVLINEFDSYKGDIAFAKNTTIGYLSQNVISNVNHTLIEEVSAVFQYLHEMADTLRKLENQLAKDPNNIKLIEEYGKKQNHFTSLDGYNYHYLIDTMISKFGFKKEDYTRKIVSFSGGEQTKIAFIKLLLMKPNLLILDEPTNHLDLSTIEWLEQYLKSYQGAVLFVSHDRYFIDALANKIIEIENNTSSYYKGNYSFYVTEKQNRYNALLNSYNSQQKEIAKLKRFIEFYMPKPRFVSRAKDRQKKLDHMKIINLPKKEKKSFNLTFNGEIIEGKEIFKVENLKVGYNESLVNNINFSFYGQDHIAIMGSNGCGKTTLLEALFNKSHILSGNVHYVRNVKVGYLKQHQTDLSDELTLLEEVQKDFPLMGEKEVYNYLGRFNFSFDDSNKYVKYLSGGEKTRLSLAKMMLNNYDVLFLDEPTNHLDMVARQALVSALKDYMGSIIFVSHDRYFVDEVCNKILYINNKEAKMYEGNYSLIKESIIEVNEQLKSEKKSEVKEKVKKRPYINVEKIESRIKIIEEEIKKLQEEQFKEEVYMDYKKMKEIDEKLLKLNDELDELMLIYLDE